jgi:hypothetical protein
MEFRRALKSVDGPKTDEICPFLQNIYSEFVAQVPGRDRIPAGAIVLVALLP